MGIIYQIFLKNIRVYYRNKPSLFFSLLFPLVFIGVFGIAFQYGAPGNSPITIGVINLDQGIPGNTIVLSQNGSKLSGNYFSQEFIQILKNVKYEDNKTYAFDINLYNSSIQAQSDLLRRNILALVIIPSNFSLLMMSKIREFVEKNHINASLNGFPPTNYTSNIVVKGDSTLLGYTITSTIVSQIANSYVNFSQANSQRYVILEGTTQTKGITVFDLTTPGLLIFAILNNLGTITAVALMDKRFGFLDRLKLSKLKPWQYIFGFTLSQILVAFVQVPIMFFAAVLFGFQVTTQYLPAFVFIFFFALSVTGMGLFLASFISNPDSAGGISAIIGTPMAFLAGAFFQIPNPVIIGKGGILGDHIFRVFDFLPATPTLTGLRLLLIDGVPLQNLSFELSLVAALSILYFVIGLIFYARRHLRTN